MFSFRVSSIALVLLAVAETGAYAGHVSAGLAFPDSTYPSSASAYLSASTVTGSASGPISVGLRGTGIYAWINTHISGNLNVPSQGLSLTPNNFTLSRTPTGSGSVSFNNGYQSTPFSNASLDSLSVDLLGGSSQSFTLSRLSGSIVIPISIGPISTSVTVNAWADPQARVDTLGIALMEAIEQPTNPWSYPGDSATYTILGGGNGSASYWIGASGGWSTTILGIPFSGSLPNIINSATTVDMGAIPIVGTMTLTELAPYSTSLHDAKWELGLTYDDDVSVPLSESGSSGGTTSESLIFDGGFTGKVYAHVDYNLSYGVNVTLNAGNLGYNLADKLVGTVVPEPTTLLLILAGPVVATLRRRRRA